MGSLIRGTRLLRCTLRRHFWCREVIRRRICHITAQNLYHSSAEALTGNLACTKANYCHVGDGIRLLEERDLNLHKGLQIGDKPNEHLNHATSAIGQRVKDKLAAVLSKDTDYARCLTWSPLVSVPTDKLSLHQSKWNTGFVLPNMFCETRGEEKPQNTKRSYWSFSIIKWNLKFIDTSEIRTISKFLNNLYSEAFIEIFSFLIADT